MKAGFKTTEAMFTAAAMGGSFVMAAGGLHWGHSLAMCLAAGMYCMARARTKKGGDA